MKDFGTAAREAIAAGRAMSVGAVFIAVPGEPFAVWGGYGDLVIDGQTHTGLGDRGLVSSSSGAVGSGDQGVTLELSGIEPKVLELADTRAANRADVVVRRLIFDSSGRTLLAAPVFSRGRLDKISTKDTIGGTSTIRAMVEGAVRGLGRTGGRMRSNADQRLADKHTQGPFANDIAFNSAATGPVVQPSGQKLTGYECIDCEYSNILYNVGSSISLVMEVGSGWVLKNISLVRGQGANIQEAYVDPFPRGSTQTETVSGIAHPAAGTASHLAVHSLGAIPGMTVTKSVAYDAVKGGRTGLSGPPNQNEAVRTAYYSTFYAQPGAVDPFDQFIPKVGGALVQGDGSYAGGLNPDGSWATGAAF